MRNYLKILLAILAFGLSSVVFALPALQLGPGGDGTWVYDDDEEVESWICTADCDGVTAYANATKDDGGAGKYAWEDEDTEYPDTIAYLVVSAVPSTGVDGAFDVDVRLDGELLGTDALGTPDEYGFGTPPAADANKLPGHGIYDTYYEVYEFTFEDMEEIFNTQPGEDVGESGWGYVAEFDIDVLDLGGATGLHFDLYTLSMVTESVETTTGRGRDKVTTTEEITREVYTFAPPSHDAEFHEVPEPGSLALLGLGLLGLGLGRWKRSA